MKLSWGEGIPTPLIGVKIYHTICLQRNANAKSASWSASYAVSKASFGRNPHIPKKQCPREGIGSLAGLYSAGNRIRLFRISVRIGDLYRSEQKSDWKSGRGTCEVYIIMRAACSLGEAMVNLSVPTLSHRSSFDIIDTIRIQQLILFSFDTQSIAFLSLTMSNPQ